MLWGRCQDGGGDASCCAGGDDTYGAEVRFCTEVNTAQSYASVIDDPDGDARAPSLDSSGGGVATSSDFVGLPGTTSPAPFALFGAGSRTEITTSGPAPQLPVGMEVRFEHTVP